MRIQVAYHYFVPLWINRSFLKTTHAPSWKSITTLYAFGFVDIVSRVKWSGCIRCMLLLSDSCLELRNFIIDFIRIVQTRPMKLTWLNFHHQVAFDNNELVLIDEFSKPIKIGMLTALFLGRLRHLHRYLAETMQKSFLSKCSSKSLLECTGSAHFPFHSQKKAVCVLNLIDAQNKKHILAKLRGF